MFKTAKIYIIQGPTESEEIEDLYYCKKKKTRNLIYETLLMLDYGDHYKEWAKLHRYDCNNETWDYYLDNIQPDDDYVFIDGIISKDDIIYKNFMIEDLVEKFEEK